MENKIAESVLNATIANPVQEYALAVAQDTAKTEELRQKAVTAYTLVQTYEELKDLNALFNAIYVNSVMAKGIDEATAKNRCKDYTSKLRASAKKLGWEQPANPNSTARKTTAVKQPTYEEAIELKDENGETHSVVKMKMVIDSDTIAKMVSLAVKAIPNTVYNALFTKEGGLKPALLKTAEAETVSKETLDIIKAEMIALIDEVKAKAENREQTNTEQASN